MMTSDDTDDAQMALALFDQPEIMRKPVQAIHMAITGGNQNKTQRLAFNAMLKHALEEHAKNPQLVTDTYAIPRVQLMRMIGYTSPNRKHLKDVLTQMQEFKVQWDFLKQDSTAQWASCVLVPYISFDKDKIYYSYAPQIKPMLFTSKVYARLDLSIQRQFRLDCAAALYEWVVRYRSNPSQRTNEMPWEDWRWVIYGEIHETSVLNEYKMFKREKLKPAILEINSKSDLLIELVENKDGGRSVKLLQFIVKEKPTTKAEPDDAGEIDEWDKRLEEFGLSVRDRKKIFEKFSVETIDANYRYTIKRLADATQSPIKSSVSYFKRALEGNYAGEQPRKTEAVQATDPMAEITKQFNQTRNDEAASYFAELDADVQQACVDEYNNEQSIKEAKVPPVGEKRLNRHLIPFYTWLAKRTWGEPTTQEIFEFALKSGAISIKKPE